MAIVSFDIRRVFSFEIPVVGDGTGGGGPYNSATILTILKLLINLDFKNILRIYIEIYFQPHSILNIKYYIEITSSLIT